MTIEEELRLIGDLTGEDELEVELSVKEGVSYFRCTMKHSDIYSLKAHQTLEAAIHNLAILVCENSRVKIEEATAINTKHLKGISEVLESVPAGFVYGKL